MASKRTKTRYINLTSESGMFSTLFKRFSGEKNEYNFADLSVLRRLLSNEKAKMLHIIKSQKPESIYSLTKILGRDFKSVSRDIRLLEKLGFIEFIAQKKGNRIRHKPIVVVDEIIISLSI